MPAMDGGGLLSEPRKARARGGSAMHCRARPSMPGADAGGRGGRRAVAGGRQGLCHGTGVRAQGCLGEGAHWAVCHRAGLAWRGQGLLEGQQQSQDVAALCSPQFPGQHQRAPPAGAGPGTGAAQGRGGAAALELQGAQEDHGTVPVPAGRCPPGRLLVPCQPAGGSRWNPALRAGALHVPAPSPGR